MISVEYLLVAFTDLTLTAFDIPKLRGFFSRKYADEHCKYLFIGSQ